MYTISMYSAVQSDSSVTNVIFYTKDRVFNFSLISNYQITIKIDRTYGSLVGSSINDVEHGIIITKSGIFGQS